jgi:hypothetical protein
LKARKDLSALSLFLLFLGAACSAGPDFEEARALDTQEAYVAYLEKHPDNKDYSPEAKRRLESLRFQQAQELNTYEAYARFLKKYRFGPYADQAAQAAEDIRAEEFGISLYRAQPADFYTWVDSRRLPYRILVLSSSQDMAATNHVERKWYMELLRRGLFVPMDPQKAYQVSPDLTLHVRESVINLCIAPLALVEAEVRVGGATVKKYRIAAGHIEKYLLYEIFRDQRLYDPLLRPSKEAVQDVEDRFERCQRGLPLKGSLALEFDLPQQAPEADQEMIREFVKFLRGLPISENLLAYPRGRPSGRLVGQRIYLSVDQELHYPRASKRWSTVGSSVDWAEWNTKRILVEREYCFKKMTLDILDLLLEGKPPGSG